MEERIISRGKRFTYVINVNDIYTLSHLLLFCFMGFYEKLLIFYLSFMANYFIYFSMFAVTLQYTVQTSRAFGVKRLRTDIKASLCTLIRVTVVAFA